MEDLADMTRQDSDQPVQKERHFKQAWQATDFGAAGMRHIPRCAIGGRFRGLAQSFLQPEKAIGV
jgi:hypothetical protein